MVSLHFAVTLPYILLIFCIPPVSINRIFPFSFSDITPNGNGVPNIGITDIFEKKETRNEDPDITFETSVYVTSMTQISDQSFKIIKLSNEIEVILNSAPKMDECEISIINRVGSIHEPANLHGLGFYLMNVLVSAQKDNKGQGFTDFSMDNSISLTYEPHSTYSIFNIVTAPSLFESTLSASSGMFKTPVITEEVMEKALNLLNKKLSENTSTMKNHFECLALSDPKSTFSRNRYGNTDTLKTIPESKKIDMKQSLTKFFQDQYSSNRLILSVRSRYPIHVMQDLVKKYFINIPNKSLPLLDQHKPFNSLHVNPFSYSTGKILYNIESNSQILKLVFPLKNFILPYMRSDPLFFIRSFICKNRDGSLIRHLNEKNYAYMAECNVVNSSYGFTNLYFNFHLSGFGVDNIHKIIQMFFFAISKIKTLKLNLNYYIKSKQEYLNGIKFSKKYFDRLDSSLLLNNYFKYKSTTFKSILLGLDKFSDFDIGLNRQILSDIRPENLIIVFNFIDKQIAIKDTKAFSQFDQSIAKRDCFTYEQFLNEQKSFNYITLTNVLSSEFAQVVRSNYSHKYILEKQNFCLQKYFLNFPESLSQELKITNLDAENSSSRINVDSYRSVKKLAVPVKLSQLLTSDSSRAHNFSQFKDFYYYIPHISPTSKIYLAVNFFFPFEDSRLASIRSIRIVTILILFWEVLASHRESVTSRLGKFEVEFTPSIIFPSESVVNAFGISLILASVPEAFSNLISNCSVNVNKYINLDSNTFQQFVEYYNNYLSNLIEQRQPELLFSDFVNQINMNHHFSSSLLLNELKTLTVEELRMVLNIIFKQSKVSGVIYGNLNPKEAELYLSKFFSEMIGDTPNKSSRLKTVPRSILKSKMKSSRMFSKIRSNQTKSRKIALTTKKSKFTLKRTQRTKKNDRELQKIVSEISSRSGLYKLHSSRLSKSGLQICKNLQVIDISSIKVNSRFFLHAYSDSITENLSIIWIYIDKASPESFVFVEYLKYIINNRISASQGRNDGIKIAVKNQKISSNSYFISIEGSANKENFSAMNDLLSSYIDKFFSPNSVISNEALFNSAKEYLLRKFKKEGAESDAQLSNIFYEITNQRFDFVRFRSIANLLNVLTFDQFISNLQKIYSSTFSIMFSVSRTDSKPYLPNGFTCITKISDIFKNPGIMAFKPEYSRIDKQSSKAEDKSDFSY